MRTELLPKALGSGAIAWLLMALPSTAQTIPETSGSSWFYSPSHYPPFKTPAQAGPSVPPCPRHAEHSRKHELPC